MNPISYDALLAFCQANVEEAKKQKDTPKTIIYLQLAEVVKDARVYRSLETDSTLRQLLLPKEI